MSEVPKLQRFNKNTGHPKWPISFYIVFKKMNFSGSPKKIKKLKKNCPKPKKCSIYWVSHMFSIWKYHYSYGICFGTIYALQNSTPNISIPNILSFFFSVHTRRVEIGHILSRRSWLYIYICIYIYIEYIIYRIYIYIYEYLL
jgi:hypothetical protein